jgi:hypothetical protein
VEIVETWGAGKLQTLAGVAASFLLVWFGLWLPLVFALGIYFALPRLLEARAGASIWGFGALVSIVVIECIHFALLTRGTGEILGPELLGGAFDSLAQAFLRGSSEVDPASIRWEAFVVDGRAYLYFGPWPALLRLPLEVVAPNLAGQWARLSCFVASSLACAAFALLALRMLAKNTGLELEDKRLLLVTSLLGFGLATPFTFLMNAGSIYHEPILWGVAGSLCFVAVLVPGLAEPEELHKKLPLLSFIAGAAFLARATYGGPLYLILLLIAASHLMDRVRSAGVKLGAVLGELFVRLLPAGLMLLFQLWYNFDRFGSALTFVDFGLSGYVQADPATVQILDRAGVFNLARVIPALGNYFIPGAEMVSREFPWFTIVQPQYPDEGLYPRIYASYLMPLLAPPILRVTRPSGKRASKPLMHSCLADRASASSCPRSCRAAGRFRVASAGALD